MRLPATVGPWVFSLWKGPGQKPETETSGPGLLRALLRLVVPAFLGVASASWTSVMYTRPILKIRDRQPLLPCRL